MTYQVPKLQRESIPFDVELTLSLKGLPIHLVRSLVGDVMEAVESTDAINR